MSGSGEGGGGEEKQWKCGGRGKSVKVNVRLQRVGSIVRDIGEQQPCLSQSPIKVYKMLKPEKWQATFDCDGKVCGFRKALKLIILGGVDPSIRPQVWEFLLGCYELGSTTEYRRKLRIARRERYKNLINQCQRMHSSIGTGTLAYAVGSKVMDMRTSSRDDRENEAKVESGRASVNNTNRFESSSGCDNNCTDTSYDCKRKSSIYSGELVSGRESADNSANGSSCNMPTFGTYNGGSTKGEEADGSLYTEDSPFDFPALPITDLFDKRGKDETESSLHEKQHYTRRRLRYKEDWMHTFQIDNNADLIMESSDSASAVASGHNNCEIEMVSHDEHKSILQSNGNGYKEKIENGLRISDVPETSLSNGSMPQCVDAGEDRVSEWLWTLHRIVVDVVRTDTHLEFYEDKRNLARMSDILAVHAWVDPATGYCQGMSDLLSPFVVLFEDNADAFWCFEMLLRRMRENFQMEGPTGVMKQLEALWHILELTDKEMFSHLSHIGAESLHFAFRMLMVLFRRELSFSEALRMWEMMWAADFDESISDDLEENCLEALVVHPSQDPEGDTGDESTENGDCSSNDDFHSQAKNANVEQSVSDGGGMKLLSAQSFCGLTKSFWSRNDGFQISSAMSSTKNGDDELPVFCVAAILVMNRQKIIRQTRSIDDMIKIFNDNLLKIHVRRCVSTAIKLRKKYFYKLIKKKEACYPNW